MKAIRDEGFFKLYLKGDVLIVAFENTEAVPSLGYHAVMDTLEAMKTELEKRDLTTTGWYALYDFSALINYEVKAAAALANIFRWARSHGRRKAAHIFPDSNDGDVFVIKRLVLALVDQLSKVNNDHY